MGLSGAMAVHAQAVRTLKEVLQLKMTSDKGANGGNVAWHPVQKKYYAAISGNAAHQMGIYDVKGNMVSKPEQQTLFDVRGLWYNPATHTLQANGYKKNGWVEYTLDDKGIPVSVKPLFEGSHQPDDQSVGAFDPKTNLVYFFDNTNLGLSAYNVKDGNFVNTIDIFLNIKSKEQKDTTIDTNEDLKENYNLSSVIFTGIKNQEIGLLSFFNKRIELYNLSTGMLTQVLNLPADAPVTDFLNFSYANDTYWLFDNKARIWKGYK